MASNVDWFVDTKFVTNFENSFCGDFNQKHCRYESLTTL